MKLLQTTEAADEEGGLPKAPIPTLSGEALLPDQPVATLDLSNITEIENLPSE